MTEPVLSDEILLSVEKPARYIGNEINAVKKDPAQVGIRFAMCFPDIYEIGMSHIGIQILYEMFNRRPDVYCERVFSPWTDLDRIMREKKIPLFTLETQTPVKNFDFLGITIQYEMCYTNILQILDLSGIPLHADERTEEDPLVIGGGPCTYNPEPIAAFFDLFYIGEGEVVYDRLFDLYLECRKNHTGRAGFLAAAANIPGIYVPSLYRVSYRDDGTIDTFGPTVAGIPEKIERQAVRNLDDAVYIEKPIVPFIKVVQDRVPLEIMRGCIRGCRFCQAGFVYRPLREHSPAYLKEHAKKMLASTGQDEISLSSLSSSDYSGLAEVLDCLTDEAAFGKLNVSLPSLRIDSFSLQVMNKIQDVRKSSLTFAPEAGTQRLRDVINKGISEDEIMNGSSEAFRGGWNRVKFYFMLGLPTETEEDRQGIPELCERVAELYYDIPKDERNGHVRITASSSFFVPKPFTPFQWARMCTEQEYLDRAHFVKDTFRTMKNWKSMKYEYHDADVTILEGVFARGDRKIARVIETAYRKGALFDSWSDCFRPEIWQESFAVCGLSSDFYTGRERGLDETFPWDFIDIGVTRDYLQSEWANAMAGRVTPNCREACRGCGARKYCGGVCYENTR